MGHQLLAFGVLLSPLVPVLTMVGIYELVEYLKRRYFSTSIYA